MRRRRVDSQLERQFLIGLVTSKPFLASVVPVLDLNLLKTTHVRTVAEWCVSFYKTYGEAPGKSLESIFYSWSEVPDRDEDEVDSIKSLLESLSDQHDQAADELNVSHLIDEVGKYLMLRKLEKLSEDLSAKILEGDEKEALRVVTSFESIELGQGCGFPPLVDRSAWERTFSAPAEPMITYPGDAGRFLNEALTRDSLIAIQAPEKRGKTWWCLDFALHALRQRRQVAFFQVGDLSERQLMMRLAVRLIGRPMYEYQCGDVEVPVKLERIEETEGHEIAVNVKKKIVSCKSPVSMSEAIRACERMIRGCGLRKDGTQMMFSIHPNSSINVMGICSILDRWQNEKGFIPDVVIIDYADILSPEPSSFREFRHQVNETWKALRRLSQERHCLAIVPTQANATSYGSGTMMMSAVSEDKRKMAHVTGMLGLNQTEVEKVHGVMRLNWIVLRESPFDPRRCLYVAQCLPIGKAFCCSTL